MAIFVLVHGGGHGGWCYKPVAQRLRAAGHEVHTPTLSGLADRAHVLSGAIDLDTHIDDVAGLLEYEDLTDAILVGHSYGGMVITGAADRKPARVGHRVYLDAAYPRDGESLYEHAHEQIHMAKQGLHDVNGVAMVMAPMPGFAAFFGVTDPQLGAWTDARLTAQPWKCFEQKIAFRNEAAMRAIPESHLICTSTIPGRDMALLTERSEGRVWDIDTGHDLMLTEPDWVAERLEAVAAA
ncbi:alpha/beta fold hydrolase [Novosphingobium aerophilum]|uniref:alpha/beta hydrolase n=1 Tax=Novosphingobium TaxID=165696 RepID=UPI0006C88E8D|nr:MULTISPECIES: alpha/beta hydrolase [unclassified Novosphingobium]KPH64450.1 esterase [Novosphingobium sp. ST904]MPS68755.1 alpha/beta hydrolase [Novosphingobium sp.]TCM31078.1 pimeloyl-ACP methyl ester carboxylesterase [Novosphingobium sp. ST904]WRT93523.1 alpha/beta hydrolase [Novosphingobium sp. RL4]